MRALFSPWCRSVYPKKACWFEVGRGERKIHRGKVDDDAGGRIEIVNVEFRLFGKIENDARARLITDDPRLVGDKRLRRMGCRHDGD